MTKQIGSGTTLSGSTSGAIGQIIDSVSGPSAALDDIDSTDMAVTSFARTFIPGLIDNGQIDITVIYDGAAAGTANVLNTSFIGRTAQTWTITYPDTSLRSFSGYINALGQETPLEEKITQTLSIKVSGVVTFTDVV